MILIVASALALISEPVVCDLTAQGRNIDQRGPTGFTVACPADHPEAAAIQAAAEASIAAMDLPLPRPRGNPAPMLWAASQLTMQVTDGAWQPAPRQPLVRAAPVLSERTAARGSISILCTIGFTPNANGTDPQPQAACVTNPSTESAVREQTSNMRQLASLWRFAPVAARYCMEEDISVTATRLNRRTGEQEAAPTVPHPALLPNLCEAG